MFKVYLLVFYMFHLGILYFLENFLMSHFHFDYRCIMEALSGFKTSDELIIMNGIFWKCISLISLNLSNFNKSNVSNFGHMLYNYESLEWFTFSNIKIDKIALLENMFNRCKNLISVNLSNFYTTNLEKNNMCLTDLNH